MNVMRRNTSSSRSARRHGAEAPAEKSEDDPPRARVYDRVRRGRHALASRSCSRWRRANSRIRAISRMPRPALSSRTPHRETVTPRELLATVRERVMRQGRMFLDPQRQIISVRQSLPGRFRPASWKLIPRRRRRSSPACAARLQLFFSHQSGSARHLLRSRCARVNARMGEC